MKSIHCTACSLARTFLLFHNFPLSLSLSFAPLQAFRVNMASSSSTLNKIALTFLFLGSTTVLACIDGQHQNHGYGYQQPQPYHQSQYGYYPRYYQPYASASSNEFFTVNRGPFVMTPVRRFPSTDVSSSNTVPVEAGERIVIPVGSSYVKPVQYVDSFAPFDSPNLKQSPSTLSVTTTNATTNGTADAVGSESKVHVVNTINRTRFKPRLIELESRNIPLTIQFTSRPSRLNIIDNDLMGQDSNIHDSARAAKQNGGEKPRTMTLDSRMIFGRTKQEEPLVLKPGAGQQHSIPSNMQSIIKCVFPDFKFDGDDKVKSAC